MRRDPRTSSLPAEPPARQDIMSAYPNSRNATPGGRRTSSLPAEPPARQDIMSAYPNSRNTAPGGRRTSPLFPNPRTDRASCAQAG
jgi:hypothetical protein